MTATPLPYKVPRFLPVHVYYFDFCYEIRTLNDPAAICGITLAFPQKARSRPCPCRHGVGVCIVHPEPKLHSLFQLHKSLRVSAVGWPTFAQNSKASKRAWNRSAQYSIALTVPVNECYVTAGAERLLLSFGIAPRIATTHNFRFTICPDSTPRAPWGN